MLVTFCAFFGVLHLLDLPYVDFGFSFDTTHGGDVVIPLHLHEREHGHFNW